MEAITNLIFGQPEWKTPPILPKLESNKKKYDMMEPFLHLINKKIALSNEEITRNQKALAVVVNIIETMNQIDPMFSRMTRNIYYGGSYYDGLKLKKPDEYDLDLILTLPKLCKPDLEFEIDKGYAKVKLNNYSSFKNHPDHNYYKKMPQFVDHNNYLVPAKFRDWFKSIFRRACNEIERTKRCPFKFFVRDSGPACTIRVVIHDHNSFVDIDLVPSIIFEANYWPKSPYRPIPYGRGSFLVVPKPITHHGFNLCWRLSLQEQEREFMRGRDRLKCCIRLIKLLRDEQGHTAISSYFIKTVFLWMIVVCDTNFWTSNSLSYTLMMALEYYCNFLENDSIPYFWNKNFNLLDNLAPSTITNFRYRIKRIIKDINLSLNDPELLKRVLFKHFASSIMTEGVYQESIREESSSCIIL